MKKGSKTHATILQLLKRLPSWINDWAKDCIEVIEKTRWVTNKRMDGSYDHETGKIILWNPDPVDKLGLFIILSHEIGHKIYQEKLNQIALRKWLEICSQEPIEKSIQESYPPHIAPEEQFCWLTSIAACLNFFDEKMVRKSKKKEQEILKTNPRGYKFAKSALTKQPTRSSPRKKINVEGIFHWQVVALKKWLFDDPHIKTFKK